MSAIGIEARFDTTFPHDSRVAGSGRPVRIVLALFTEKD